jgi:short subunit dehydrogenase-like uncharacterized protein
LVVVPGACCGMRTSSGRSALRLSQLDAAVKVLTESGQPMTTKAMIEAMATEGYGTSPGGATPAQTLYSALLREISQKGDASRFIKADKGLFSLK